MHPLDILFWACLMLGGVYTLFSLLMGGLTHAAGHASHLGDTLHLPHISDFGGQAANHAELGHTAGHGGIGHGHAGHAHAEVGHGHAEAGHHGHDGHHHGEADVDGGRFNLLAYLNPMAVSGFLIGFGGGGVITGMLAPGASSLVRLLIGGATGWGLWLVAWLIVTRLFGGAEGTSHNRREQIVGLRASVTAPIDGSKPGMVAYEVAGQRQVLRAITDDDEPIPTGAAVRIRKVEESTALVMRIDG